MSEENKDNQPVKSKHDLLMERMSSRYPDKDFSDSEAYEGQIYDDFDQYDKELDTYRGHEKAFSDMFASDPRSASFVTDWKNGEDPVIGLVRRFGPELRDALDDPKLVDQLAEANKAYVDRMQKNDDIEKQFQENFPKTQQYFADAVESGKMTEDEVDDVFEKIRDIVTDGMVGIFKPETIDLIAKAIHHDADVEDAAREGEVKGRNAKIEEKLRRSERGDGTASLDGKNGAAPRERREDSIFGLANMAR